MKCLKCQESAVEGAVFCSNCGEPLPPPEESASDHREEPGAVPGGAEAASPRCSSCGAPASQTPFCTACGARLGERAPESERAAAAEPAAAPAPPNPAGPATTLWAAPAPDAHPSPHSPAPAAQAAHADYPTQYDVYSGQRPPQQPYAQPYQQPQQPYVQQPAQPGMHVGQPAAPYGAYPPAQREPRKRGAGTAVLIIGGVVVLALALVGGAYAFVASRDNGSAAATTQTSPSAASSPAADESTPTAAGAGSSSPDAGGNAPAADGGQLGLRIRPRVYGLPAGLSCHALASRGWNFAEADAYWQAKGRPTSMDADANGIPCQTVYSDFDVRSVYGSRVDTSRTNVALLPAGLGCDYFTQFGLAYRDAVAYWRRAGSRQHLLDPNGDGIPCENTYPPGAVSRYWGF